MGTEAIGTTSSTSNVKDFDAKANAFILRYELDSGNIFGPFNPSQGLVSRIDRAELDKLDQKEAKTLSAQA